MNRVLIAAVAATTLFAGPVMAQSAKFAASWDDDPVVVEAYATDEAAMICNDGTLTNGYCIEAELEMAQLHVGSKKSILVGVSSEIGIHLITRAKGKGGVSGAESATAKAEGAVEVVLSLVDVDDSAKTCDIAPSDRVTLKSEMRELTVSATATEGDIEVEVAIDTDSIGAHHFEFLGVECEQGTYRLTATFNLSALASASGYDADSTATVTLMDRMITMQEVRAVKGSLVEDPIN